MRALMVLAALVVLVRRLFCRSLVTLREKFARASTVVLCRAVPFCAVPCRFVPCQPDPLPLVSEGESFRGCLLVTLRASLQVEPGSLPTLLSTGMSSECFSVVLKVFEVNLLPQHAAYVVEFLRWLAETPRFSMMVCCVARRCW